MPANARRTLIIATRLAAASASAPPGAKSSPNSVKDRTPSTNHDWTQTMTTFITLCANMRRWRAALARAARPKARGTRTPMPRVFRAQVLAAAALMCATFSGAVQAQSSKLGAYSGTVVVSGTELGQEKVSFSASVKIKLPLTSSDKNSAMAELDDVDKPSAVATITQWDVVGKNGSADSDGKVTTWICKLAAPAEVPMNGSGTLNLDYRAKTHSMFVALVARKTIPLQCVNSRSGPYKKDQLVSLFFGTSEPDVQPWKELPYKDAAQLSATFKLVPVSHMKGRNGPLDQQWDLRLVR